MEQRLTQAQLQQIVAEVQKLSQRSEAELDKEQVREILRELNSPPEFLEEAMVQLHRREALALQQRRNRWIVGSAIGAIALLVVGMTLFIQHQNQSLTQITAQSTRITLVQDDGGNLSTVSRQVNTDLYYRVTLSNAPVGQKLSLSCNWIDPSGRIVHQNHYQTKDITTPIWHSNVTIPLARQHL